MLTDIKIRSLAGAGIKTYIPSIVQVRSQVLRDLPFLRNGNVEEDARYFQRISQNKDAIAVLVFDGPNVVGVSVGFPLELERPLLHTPFLEKKEEISSYFNFGTSTLLPAYRGRGLAHHFFDIRETHAQRLKRFKKICFAELASPSPAQAFTILDAFWKKRGYVQRKDLTYKYGKESVELIYWVKEIVQPPVDDALARDVNLILNGVF